MEVQKAGALQAATAAGRAGQQPLPRVFVCMLQDCVCS